jgi:DNA-binding winged helix-turn-helix (wHTH) protein
MQGRRLRFGDYVADFGLQELRRGGRRVGLQHKPFRVLERLLHSPGELVTRKELFAYLWPDSHVSFERGLNSAMNSLRQVLGESSREFHFIETRAGLGYRFIAAVEDITAAKPVTPPHLEAYQDCLKGRYLLDRMGEEEIHKALAYFNSAASAGSCSAPAHCGIADAYCQLAMIDSVCSAKLASQARSSAAYALECDPDSAPAFVSSGRVKMLFDWDWSGAQEAVARAIELDANCVSAHILQASLLCTLGHFEAAIGVCSSALLIDPVSFPANLELAACLYAARHFEASADHCWRMLSLEPGFAPAQVLLALAYEQLSQFEEAMVEYQNAQLSSACRVPAISGLCAVCAVAGLSSESETAYRELSDLSRNRYVSSYWQAVVFAGRKQSAQAVACLEESFQRRDPAALWLKADARFDFVRDEPRYKVLVDSLDG